MDKKDGFTVIELIIVIVIVGVLSILAVPVYRGYTQKAKYTEGDMLAGLILSAQKAYFAENKSWYSVSTVSFDTVLNIDARGNKYFNRFSTNLSAKRSGAVEAVAVSNELDVSVYKYWIADVNQANTISLPKRDIYDAGGGNLLETNW
ncbi:MAG: prepilin-type N-terminal cleavage/methylation domain-containing protein [Endomicrobium sp.]|jgi:prepilin-type N-terminal cleavage/methylation domain-containing protein|nr:prepilin-type N-terminal cleavage/methylation domain-containing protein [Endomicrobium sp.]